MTKPMIQCQLKLMLRPAQERMLIRWLWHLTAVYNWAVRKIEVGAKYRIYYSRYDIRDALSGHYRQLGIPSHVINATVCSAHDAWERCFRRLARRPRMKGRRNKLNSIAFPDPFGRPLADRIALPYVGVVRFHKQFIPEGRIKCGRIIRRASGWYLCLFVEACPQSINLKSGAEIGIDPGFKSLLTLSDGRVIQHPDELRRSEERVAQAQRGCNQRLRSRLQERTSNRRRDRNHKLSRNLVAENATIYWSSDRHVAIAKAFGKSVASAAHGQLRQMLAYKCRAGGREFIEVSNRYSTMTCSACGARSGPTGYAGLSVRQWRCGCGAEHDRDVNAAVNTLLAGRGLRLEGVREGTSEIATGGTR